MTNEPAMSADPFQGERPRHTHFHERQAALNVREAWSAWNGFRFADYYYDPEYEYFCIRNFCGTYDICPMQKYYISGPDAAAMLDRMVTRDIKKLNVNRVTYCVWCTDEGRIVDDGTIFRISEDTYMLTCGSPSVSWLRKSASGFDDLTITDMTDEIAGLSLQGPTSYSTLKAMGLEGLETLKPFGIMRFPFNGVELMVSRTGFTGDLGYELWIDPSQALAMWDALYAAGKDFGIHPYGETATDMARLEAGFIMPDMELSESLKTIHFEHDQSPFELNLGWLVDFKKPHFNGRRALLEERERGPKWTLVKLDIPGNKVAEGAIMYDTEDCDNEIGYVTSAMWSPSVKANIALAMIKTPALKGDIWAEIYYQKELRYYRKMALCEVKDKPFWMPARTRQTPPEVYS